MEITTNNNRKITFTTILEDEKKATTFKHFKGKTYKILTIAKDSEDLSLKVIYQGQYDDNPCWIRNIDDFFSEVDSKKYPNVKQTYRFEKLD